MRHVAALGTLGAAVLATPAPAAVPSGSDATPPPNPLAPKPFAPVLGPLLGTRPDPAPALPAPPASVDPSTGSDGALPNAPAPDSGVAPSGTAGPIDATTAARVAALYAADEHCREHARRIAWRVDGVIGYVHLE